MPTDPDPQKGKTARPSETLTHHRSCQLGILRIIGHARVAPANGVDVEDYEALRASSMQ